MWAIIGYIYLGAVVLMFLGVCLEGIFGGDHGRYGYGDPNSPPD